MHCKHNLWTIWIVELTKGADIGRKTENKKEVSSSDGQNNIFSSYERKLFHINEAIPQLHKWHKPSSLLLYLENETLVRLHLQYQDGQMTKKKCNNINGINVWYFYI